MGKKVESFLSDDGQLFKNEYDMIRHEAWVALTEEFPELKIAMKPIMDRAERLAEILEPLATYCRINHPAEPPETTVQTIRERCSAVQYSDQMVCAPCDQSWDTNDSFPPPCKPPVAEGCAHDWETDSPCAFVDTCRLCGEQRA